MTLSDVLFQKNTKNHDSNHRHITNNVNDFHALIDFGTFILSIVQQYNPYGDESGLFEIGCFNKDPDTGYADKMISIPGVTDDGDTIKGWLSFAYVDKLLRQLTFESLTVRKFKPEQVLVTSSHIIWPIRKDSDDAVGL